MDNNDILIRLRYALDMRDNQMQEAFKLGKMELSIEDVKKLLMKTKGDYLEGEEEENIPCDDHMLEAFLNGLIVLRRGEPNVKPGQTPPPEFLMDGPKNKYNVLLKKLRIALNLTGDDVREVLESVNCSISKGELSALFRKEGHRNYRPCGERYIRNFLKGLTIRYRV